MQNRILKYVGGHRMIGGKCLQGKDGPTMLDKKKTSKEGYYRRVNENKQRKQKI